MVSRVSRAESATTGSSLWILLQVRAKPVALSSEFPLRVLSQISGIRDYPRFWDPIANRISNTRFQVSCWSLSSKVIDMSFDFRIDPRVQQKETSSDFAHNKWNQVTNFDFHVKSKRQNQATRSEIRVLISSRIKENLAQQNWGCYITPHL